MTQLSNNLFNTTARGKYYTFADFPSIKLYKSSTGSSWRNHLLFGDYISITNLDISNNRVKARSRGNNGWVKIDQIQKHRLLEINFVDIGQGDGCHMVTPDDQHIIIDAGKTDNMNRYLSWRFNIYDKKKPLSFPFTILISHSDSDHYKGFKYVFENSKVHVDRIYHNGLVERPGRFPLGKIESGYITGLVKTTTQMKKIIKKKENRSGTRSMYCSTLFKSLKYSPGIQFDSLSEKERYVPGFANQNKIENKRFSLHILGPVTKKINGKEGLKTIKDLGKDKNGHSVILKIQYDKARILLGGDVNTEFGKILHEHYKDNLEDLRVDVAKACHHGSNHFHYPFLEAINAAATVISSGDDESYSHPRPDTIGALGKSGYGQKPLVFSTELARSNKEITWDKLQGVAKLFNKLKTLREKIKDLSGNGTADELNKLNRAVTKTNKSINSILTKYGMINVRTDGRKMIIAQKLESPASYGKWDIHELIYSNKSKRFESTK